MKGVSSVVAYRSVRHGVAREEFFNNTSARPGSAQGVTSVLSSHTRYLDGDRCNT